MRRAWAVPLAAVALVLSACTTDAPAAPVPPPTSPTVGIRADGYGPLELVEAPDGLFDATITGPDGQREMVIHLPDGPTEGAPLLVALHPFTFTGSQFQRLTGLGSEGASRGAVVVLPDGLFSSWNGSGVCCPPATSRGVDDVGFVRATVTRLREQLGVDPDRTWVTGFSNGGYLAIRLACEASDVVTAFAAHAASMDLACEPDEPSSALISHGQLDRVVPFAGAPTRGDGRGPRAGSLGAREVAARWRDVDGCTGEGTPTPDAATTDDTTTEGCEDGTEVRLVVWPGVEHAWPTAATSTFLDWFEADAERRR